VPGQRFRIPQQYRGVGVKSSKFQVPNSREAPSVQASISTHIRQRFWCLEFGFSLVLGAWTLGAFPDVVEFQMRLLCTRIVNNLTFFGKGS
jgi:hypothetical protein